MKAYLLVIPFLLTPLLSLTACGGGEEKTPFPAVTPFSTTLTEHLHQIRDRVAELRGLPVNTEMTEGIVTAEALEAYYKDAFSKLNPDKHSDFQASGAMLKMLGLIGPADDLEKLYGENFSGQILGLYLLKDNKLVLVGDPGETFSIADELTLAHEYTHSMQDGKYKLDELQEQYLSSNLEKEGYTEYSTTFRCLFEGDATFTELQYAEKYFGADWRDKAQAQAAAAEGQDTPRLPAFLQRTVSFDYTECVSFVRALYEKGGWDAVDAAFDNPPATTEQVLQPEKYFGREIANSRPPEALALMDGWEEVSSAQFGEYDIINWAWTRTGDLPSAAAAGVGWGSGWSTTYRDKSDPGRVFVRLHFTWDKRQDLAEFLIVFNQIVKTFGTEIQAVDDKGNGRWSADGQYGAISVSQDLFDVDIRMASDAAALEAETKDLPAFSTQQQ